MNQRFKIYTRGSSLNSYGELSETFTQGSSVFGRARHYTDGESLVSNKHRPLHKVEIHARHFGGGIKDHIEYLDYRWEIEGVRRSHRSSVIKIIANRLYAIVKGKYLQPNGTNFYLTPSGNYYLQS